MGDEPIHPPAQQQRPIVWSCVRTTIVVPYLLGFRDAKAALIAALETGAYAHEVRDVQEEKNLLAIGDVTEAFVIDLVRKCTGNDYSSSPHHADGTVEVHVFKPRKGRERWYVKAYFAPDASAVFVSVHRS